MARRTSILMIVIVIMAASGCTWSPELSRVRNQLEEQLPGAEFEKEIELSLGPLSLALARVILGAVDDEDAGIARKYLRDVSRVQVAVYECDNVPPVSHVKMPEAIRDLEDDGWETAVKVREEDSLAWILYKIDDNRIRELYVITLSDEELVLVKAEGDLDRLAAQAIHDAKDRERPHT